MPVAAVFAALLSVALTFDRAPQLAWIRRGFAAAGVLCLFG